MLVSGLSRLMELSNIMMRMTVNERHNPIEKAPALILIVDSIIYYMYVAFVSQYIGIIIV
jgi:hypothetical protein